MNIDAIALIAPAFQPASGVVSGQGSLRSLVHVLGYHNITRLADRPSVYNRNPIYAAVIS